MSVRATNDKLLETYLTARRAKIDSAAVFFQSDHRPPLLKNASH
jgi:hypothetical protein